MTGGAAARTDHDTARGSQGDLARAVGSRALAGGPLLAAGVALEWVLDPQGDDGTVVRPLVFALLVTTSAVGAGLLTLAARGLPSVVPRIRRLVRWGSAVASVGGALVLLGTVAVLVSGLLSGAPAGLSFVPFALGLLLLGIGTTLVGAGALRQVPWLGAGLLLAGAAAVGAVMIPVDPWHDVALMGACLAWAAVGVAVLRGRPDGY